MNTPASDCLLEQIHDLIARGDHEALEALLGCNQQARRIYLQYTIESVSLRRWATEWQDAPSERVQGSGFRVQAQTVRSWEFGVRSWMAFAATIALVIGAWFLLATVSSSPQSEFRTPQSNHVAMLSDLQSAVFSEDQRPMNLGGELAAGPIRLVSGKAQIMFNSTAVVDLIGPCEFRMIDANHGQLTSGRLEAYVPEAARGFAIDLPDGWRVVDLGTRFFVDAEPAARSVVGVIQGRVRIDSGSESHELVAGRAVTLTGGRIQSAPSMTVLASALDVYSYFAMDGQATADIGPGGKIVGTLEPTEDRFGRSAGAVKFDGASYLPLGVAWPADAYTLTAWVRPDRITGQQQYLVGVQNSGQNPGRFLRLTEQGEVQATHVVPPTRIFKVDGPVLPTGQWTHVTVTFETTGPQRGLLTLYLNGQPIAAAPIEGDSSQTESLKNLTLGARPDHPGEFPFVGAMDDVAIFNRTLSAKQVLDLYTTSESKSQTLQEN